MATERGPLARWLLNQLADQPDLTQAQLANAIGVSQQRVSEWLSGRKRPRERNCIRLARFFGGDLDRVLELAGYPPLDLPEASRAGLAVMEPTQSYGTLGAPPGTSPAAALTAIRFHPSAVRRTRAVPDMSLSYWQPPSLFRPSVYALPPGACSFDPEIGQGDTIFVDVERDPNPGDLVVVFEADESRIYRWLEQDGVLSLRDAAGSLHAVTGIEVGGVAIGIFRPTVA